MVRLAKNNPFKFIGIIAGILALYVLLGTNFLQVARGEGLQGAVQYMHVDAPVSVKANETFTVKVALQDQNGVPITGRTYGINPGQFILPGDAIKSTDGNLVDFEVDTQKVEEIKDKLNGTGVYSIPVRIHDWPEGVSHTFVLTARYKGQETGTADASSSSQYSLTAAVSFTKDAAGQEGVLRYAPVTADKVTLTVPQQKPDGPVPDPVENVITVRVKPIAQARAADTDDRMFRGLATTDNLGKWQDPVAYDNTGKPLDVRIAEITEEKIDWKKPDGSVKYSYTGTYDLKLVVKSPATLSGKHGVITVGLKEKDVLIQSSLTVTFSNDTVAKKAVPNRYFGSPYLVEIPHTPRILLDEPLSFKWVGVAWNDPDPEFPNNTEVEFSDSDPNNSTNGFYMKSSDGRRVSIKCLRLYAIIQDPDGINFQITGAELFVKPFTDPNPPARPGQDGTSPYHMVGALGSSNQVEVHYDVYPYDGYPGSRIADDPSTLNFENIAEGRQKFWIHGMNVNNVWGYYGSGPTHNDCRILGKDTIVPTATIDHPDPTLEPPTYPLDGKYVGNEDAVYKAVSGSYNINPSGSDPYPSALMSIQIQTEQPTHISPFTPIISDWADIGGNPIGGSWNYGWNTDTLNDDICTLRARAVDLAGNVSTPVAPQSSKDYVVDNTHPIANVISPIQGAGFKPPASVVIKGTAKDDDTLPLGDISFRNYSVDVAPGIDPGTGWTNIGNGPTAKPGPADTLANWTIPNLTPDSIYTMRLTAVDKAGNINMPNPTDPPYTNTLYYYVDSNPPSGGVKIPYDPSGVGTNNWVGETMHGWGRDFMSNTGSGRWEETPTGTPPLTGSLEYIGNWDQVYTSDNKASKGGYRRSNASNAAANFYFTGNFVSLIATTGPDCGTAEVWINDSVKTDVNLNRPGTVTYYQQEVFHTIVSPSLSPNKLTVKWKNTPLNAGKYVTIDAIDVAPGSGVNSVDVQMQQFGGNASSYWNGTAFTGNNTNWFPADINLTLKGTLTAPGSTVLYPGTVLTVGTASGNTTDQTNIITYSTGAGAWVSGVLSGGSRILYQSVTLNAQLTAATKSVMGPGTLLAATASATNEYDRNNIGGTWTGGGPYALSNNQTIVYNNGQGSPYVTDWAYDISPVTGNTKVNIWIRVTDDAGNTYTTPTLSPTVATVDSDKPSTITTDVTLNQIAPNGRNGWYVSPIPDLYLKATDVTVPLGTVASSLNYQWTDPSVVGSPMSGWTTWSAPVPAVTISHNLHSDYPDHGITNEGTWRLWFYALDATNNDEFPKKYADFKRDTAPPGTPGLSNPANGSYQKATFTVDGTAPSDATSLLDAVKLAIQRYDGKYWNGGTVLRVGTTASDNANRLTLGGPNWSGNLLTADQTAQGNCTISTLGATIVPAAGSTLPQGTVIANGSVCNNTYDKETIRQDSTGAGTWSGASPPYTLNGGSRTLTKAVTLKASLTLTQNSSLPATNWTSSTEVWFPTTNTSWTYSYNSDSFNGTGSNGGDGTYTFYTSATDNAGNQSSSASNVCTIDNTKPTTQYNINGVYPQNPDGSNGWYKSTNPVLALVPADATSGTNSQLTWWTMNYTPGGGTLTNKWTNQTYYNQGAWTASDGYEGQFDVTYHSDDQSGNSQAPQTVTFYKDSRRPTSTITSPAEGSYKRLTFNIHGSATDPPPYSGIWKEQIAIKLNNGNPIAGWWNGTNGWTGTSAYYVTAQTFARQQTTSWDYNWDTLATGAADGSYLVYAKAVDWAGGEQINPDDLLVTVDNTPPYITSIDPADNEQLIPTIYPIKVRFSEQMLPGTLNNGNPLTDGNFCVKTDAGLRVSGTVSYTEPPAENPLATFTTPTGSPFTIATYYKAIINRGVTDLAGNPLVSGVEESSSSVPANSWTLTQAVGNASGDNYKRTVTTNATLAMNFRGTKVTLVGAKAPTYGIASVSLYAEPAHTLVAGPTDVDEWNSVTTLWKQSLWTSATLTDGDYQIVVTCTGRPHVGQLGVLVNVDAFGIQLDTSIPPRPKAGYSGDFDTISRFTTADVNAEIYEPAAGDQVYGTVPVMGTATRTGQPFVQYKLQYKKTGDPGFTDFGTIHAAAKTSNNWPTQTDWSGGQSGGGAPAEIISPATTTQYRTGTNVNVASGQAIRLKAKGTIWRYRRPITITNEGPAMAYAQIRVPINHINGEMKLNFDDIRFTDSNGQDFLNHWKEDAQLIPDTSAVFWVKVPNVPAGTPANKSTKTIYLYYGNPNAPGGSSNGAGVFDRFDDFKDGTLDTTNLWTQLAGNGSISESSGTLNFSYDMNQGNDWSGSRQGTALILKNGLPPFTILRSGSSDANTTDQANMGGGTWPLAADLMIPSTVTLQGTLSEAATSVLPSGTVLAIGTVSNDVNDRTAITNNSTGTGTWSGNTLITGSRTLTNRISLQSALSAAAGSVLPSSDFRAVVKLKSYTVPDLTQAGIAAYGSDTSAYLWGRYRSDPNDYFRIDKVGGSAYTPEYVADTTLMKYMAITKSGSNYFMSYSSDGLTWTRNGIDKNDITLNNIALFGREWNSGGAFNFSMDDFFVQNYTTTVSTDDVNAATEDPGYPISTIYEANGSLTSSVFNAGVARDWGYVKWSQDMPPGTRMSIQVRTGNDNNPEDFAGISPANGWSEWTTVPVTVAAGEQLSLLKLPPSINWSNARYIQYKVNFYGNAAADRTPVLNDISFYNDYLELWDTKALPGGDGEYTLRLLVNNLLNDWTTTGASKHAIVYDVKVNVNNHSKPTSTISSPADNAYIKETTTATGTADDTYPGVGNYDVRIQATSGTNNGKYWGDGTFLKTGAADINATDQTNLGGGTWPLAADRMLAAQVNGLSGTLTLPAGSILPPGTVLVSGTTTTSALDAAAIGGNWNYTTSFALATATQTLTGHVRLNGTMTIPASGSVVLPAINWNKPGTDAGVWIPAADVESMAAFRNWGYDWNTKLTAAGSKVFDDGTYNLEGRATDKAGEPQTTYPLVHLTVDNTPPSVSLVFPGNAGFVSNELTALDGTVNDPPSDVNFNTYKVDYSRRDKLDYLSRIPAQWTTINTVHNGIPPSPRAWLTTTDADFANGLLDNTAINGTGEPSNVALSTILLGETFSGADGSNPDPLTWIERDNVSNYITQSNGVLNVNGGPGYWGGITMNTQRNFDRATTWRMEWDYTPLNNPGTGHVMMGWKDTSTDYSYQAYPYAIYDNGGNIEIYEQGQPAAYPGVGLSANVTYSFKIELIPSGGANYYYKLAGAPTWTPLRNSGSRTTTPLKPGFDNDDKSFRMDNFYVYKYYPQTGYYTSPVYNTGATGNVWTNIAWNIDMPIPSGAELWVSTRTGESATAGDGKWSNWSAEAPVTSNSNTGISTTGQYLQYRYRFKSNDPNYGSVTATLRDTTVTYNGAVSPRKLLEIWNTLPLAEGEYTLRLTATDKAGNQAVTYSDPVTIDKTAPHARLNKQGNQTYIHANHPLIGTADDGYWSSRLPVQVSNATGSVLTDYQVRVQVTWKAGSVLPQNTKLTAGTLALSLNDRINIGGMWLLSNGVYMLTEDRTIPLGTTVTLEDSVTMAPLSFLPNGTVLSAGTTATDSTDRNTISPTPGDWVLNNGVYSLRYNKTVGGAGCTLNGSLSAAYGMKPDFSDLRFTDSDGTSRLYFWLEPGTLTPKSSVVAWVRIPSLDAGGRTIYMYYGNSDGQTLSSLTATTEPQATAANTSEFAASGQALYHFNSDSLDPNAGWNDTSSGSPNSLTPINGVKFSTDKILGNTSAYFDGSDDALYKYPVNNFPTTAMTTEFWIKTADTNDGIISYATGTGGNENMFLIRNSANLNIQRTSSASVSTGVRVNDNVWHHVAVTWQASDGQTKLYKDGVLTYSGTIAVGSNIVTGGSLVIGQQQYSVTGAVPTTEPGSAGNGDWDVNQAFGGQIDELRISSSVLTSQIIMKDAGIRKSTMLTEPVGTPNATPDVLFPTGENFDHYELTYTGAQAGNIGLAYTQPVTNATLATWNTRRVKDGDYTIQLYSMDKAKNSATATTTVKVDNTPPLISSTDPVDGEINADAKVKPKAYFTEQMRSETITSLTYLLSGATASSVLYTTNSTSAFATFTPNADLVCGSSHTGTLKTDILDIAGNSIAKAFEENDGSVTYPVGFLGARINNSSASGLFYKESNVTGDTARQSFTTTASAKRSVVWLASTGPNNGIAQVTLRNGVGGIVDQTNVDLWSSSTVWQQAVYKYGDLTPDNYTLDVVVTAGHNPSSGGYNVNIDAFLLDIDYTWSFTVAQVTGEITSPTRNQRLKGNLVPINGVVTDNGTSGLSNWKLQYAPHGQESNVGAWQSIGTQTNANRVSPANLLKNWDTTGLNGQYTIRLTVTPTSGSSNNKIYDKLVTVDNTGPTGAAPPRMALFTDSFDARDTASWTYKENVDVPVAMDGSYTLRLAGTTGGNWNSGFSRKSGFTLSNKDEMSVDFKVNNGSADMHVGIQAYTPEGNYQRWAIKQPAAAPAGRLIVQYKDAGGYVDLLGTDWTYSNGFTYATNKWYRATFKINDDAGGTFQIIVADRDAPTKTATYSRAMPRGLMWQSWAEVWTGSAYFDNFEESRPSGSLIREGQAFTATGTATDLLTGVNLVEVKVDSGTWQPAANSTYRVDQEFGTSGANLIGEWHMDENTGATVYNTTSTTGINGTVSGTGFWTTSSAMGKSAILCSGDDMVTIPDVAALQLGQTQTVEAWVKVAATATDLVRLVGKGTTDNRNYGLWLATDGTVLYQFSNTGGTTFNAQSTLMKINDGIWHHVAGTYDGNNLKVFVDGMLAASTAVGAQTPKTSTDPLTFGSAGTIGTGLLGTIDEVKIYNVALTDDQIAKRYSEGQITAFVQEVGYAGDWRYVADGSASGGSVKTCVVPNSTATIKFKGSSITWLATKGPDRGMAQVFIDGKPITDGDTLMPVDQTGSKLASNSRLYKDSTTTNVADTVAMVGSTWSLSNGVYTLTNNPYYQLTTDVILQGLVTAAPNSRLEVNSRINSGSIATNPGDPGVIGGTWTMIEGNQALTSSQLIGPAYVTLTGTLALAAGNSAVDLYSAATQWQNLVYTTDKGAGGAPSLDPTLWHTLTIKVTGYKNGSSTGIKVDADGFDIGGNRNWFYAVNTTGMSDGAHTVYARATDRAGTTSNLPQLDFTVDAIAPIADITTPFDPIGSVLKIQTRLNNGTTAVSSLDTGAIGGTWTPLTNGVYTLNNPSPFYQLLGTDVTLKDSITAAAGTVLKAGTKLKSGTKATDVNDTIAAGMAGSTWSQSNGVYTLTTDPEKQLTFDVTTSGFITIDRYWTNAPSINIKGRATDANFDFYKLEYGMGASPTAWTAVNNNPRYGQINVNGASPNDLLGLFTLPPTSWFNWDNGTADSWDTPVGVDPNTVHYTNGTIGATSDGSGDPSFAYPSLPANKQINGTQNKKVRIKMKSGLATASQTAQLFWDYQLPTYGGLFTSGGHQLYRNEPFKAVSGEGTFAEKKSISWKLGPVAQDYSNKWVEYELDMGSGQVYGIPRTENGSASGNWLPDNNDYSSGGSQIYTTTAGASQTYSFTSSKITYISTRGADRGIARIFIDEVPTSDADVALNGDLGTSKSGVDLYRQTTAAQQVGQQKVYSKSLDSRYQLSGDQPLGGNMVLQGKLAVAANFVFPKDSYIVRGTTAKSLTDANNIGGSWTGTGPYVLATTTKLNSNTLPMTDIVTVAPTSILPKDTTIKDGTTTTSIVDKTTIGGTWSATDNHTITVQATGQKNIASGGTRIDVDAWEERTLVQDYPQNWPLNTGDWPGAGFWEGNIIALRLDPTNATYQTFDVDYIAYDPPDGQYQVRVTAQDKSGKQSVHTHSINIDTTPPKCILQAPLNNAALSSSNVVVSGTASDYTRNGVFSNVDYVDVRKISDINSMTAKVGDWQRANNVGVNWDNWSLSVPISEGWYGFQARAVDKAGNIRESNINYAQLDVSDPEAPKPKLMASKAHGGILLSWTPVKDAGSGVDYYVIYRNNQPINLIRAGELQYVDKKLITSMETTETTKDFTKNGQGGVETFVKFYGCNAIDVIGDIVKPNTSISYRVRAVDASGRFSNKSPSVSVTYDTAGPDKPQFLKPENQPAGALAGKTTCVQLQWDDPRKYPDEPQFQNSKDISEYRLYRKEKTGPLDPPGFNPEPKYLAGVIDVADASSGGTTVTKYFDPNLALNKTYYYRIVAYDGDLNTSPPSDTITVDTLPTQSNYSSTLPHKTFSQNTPECATCHHTHAAKGEMLLPQIYEAKVCFSGPKLLDNSTPGCHDGNGSNKPTQAEFDFSPSGAHRIIDERYPAKPAAGDPKGRLSCIDCHNPHLNTQNAYNETFDDEPIPDPGNPDPKKRYPFQTPDGWAACVGGTWTITGTATTRELRQQSISGTTYAKRDMASTGPYDIKADGGYFSTIVEMYGNGTAFLAAASNGNNRNGLVASLVKNGSSAYLELSDGGTPVQSTSFSCTDGQQFRIKIKTTPERSVTAYINTISRVRINEERDTITDSEIARVNITAGLNSYLGTYLEVGTVGISSPGFAVNFDIVKINNPGMLMTRYREFTTSGTSYTVPDDRITTEAFCLGCHGTSYDSPGGNQQQYYTSTHNPEIGGMNDQALDQEGTFTRIMPELLTPRWQEIRDEWKLIRTTVKLNPSDSNSPPIGSLLGNTNNGCFYCHSYHGLQFYNRTQKGEEELCYTCHGKAGNFSRDNWNVYQQYNGYSEDNSTHLKYYGTWTERTEAQDSVPAGSYSGGTVRFATGATPASPAWPNACWFKRQKIDITNPVATEMTFYTVPITFAINATDMNADLSDLRFYDDNASSPTELSYWIESIFKGNAKVWVMLPTLKANPTKTNIYMYYKNPNATSHSNMKTTFIFADDFIDNNLAANWAYSGNVIASNGYALLDADTSVNASLETNFTPPATGDFIVESKLRLGLDNQTKNQIYHNRPRLLKTGDLGPAGVNDYGLFYHDEAHARDIVWDTGTPSWTNASLLQTPTDYLMQYYLSSSTFYWRIYNYSGGDTGARIQERSAGMGVDAPNAYNKWKVSGEDNKNSDWSFDWVRVRRFTGSSDPSVVINTPVDGYPGVYLNFTGQTTFVVSNKGPGRGTASVYVDNVLQQDIPLTDTGWTYKYKAFAIDPISNPTFADGPHTINFVAKSGRVDVDAIQGDGVGSRHGLTLKETTIKCTSCHGQRAMTDRHVWETNYNTSNIADPNNIKNYWSDQRLKYKKTVNDYCNVCHKMPIDSKGRVLLEYHGGDRIRPYDVKYPPIITTSSANGYDRTGYTVGEPASYQEYSAAIATKPAIWWSDTSQPDLFDGGASGYTVTNQAYWELQFVGSYVDWETTLTPNSAIAQVFIDGERYTDGNHHFTDAELGPGNGDPLYVNSGVDLYSGSPLPIYRQIGASKSGLTVPGNHKIRIVNSGIHNASAPAIPNGNNGAGGWRIDVDAFNIRVPKVGHFLYTPLLSTTITAMGVDQKHFTVADAVGVQLAAGDTIQIDPNGYPHAMQTLTVSSVSVNDVIVNENLDVLHGINCEVANATKANCAGSCHNGLSFEGSQEAKTKITCMTCHHPHASDNPRTLRWSEDSKSGTTVKKGGCLHCHDGSVPY